MPGGSPGAFCSDHRQSDRNRELWIPPKNVNERYAVLVALVAGTGLRIGEALALRTEDFDPDCQVLHVKRSVWHRCEQETSNAIRLVDVPEPLAQVLCRYILQRSCKPLRECLAGEAAQRASHSAYRIADPGMPCLYPCLVNRCKCGGTPISLGFISKAERFRVFSCGSAV